VATASSPPPPLRDAVPAGLSEDEAARRRERYGPNTLPPPPATPLLVRVARSLRDPLVLVLLGAVVLTLATADVPDAIVITMVIVVNTTLAVRQEVRADQAVRELAGLLSPHAQVVRDGRHRSVPVADVTVGDLVVLAEGDLVPADCTVLEAVDLEVVESALTGESLPVDKHALDPAHGADDPSVLLWSGTSLAHGRALARVTAVGPDSALGRIAGLLATGRATTPFQRRMTQLSAILAGTAVALCLLVAAIGLVQGQSLELMFLTAASLAVAAVPESLPMVVTISLALAARRMARRHAVVRNLAAVETLGSVTLLATDKTGTLTQASMAVDDWWTAPDAGPDELWEAVALCNDAGRTGGGQRGLGSPMEVALLHAAEQHGIGIDAVRGRWQRVHEVAFDRDRKRMSTVHQAPDGGYWTICKGAPEAVLAPSVVDVGPELRAEALRRAHRLAETGSRVLAVAGKHHAAVAEPLERDLELIGLVSLNDPPRAEAAGTVAACHGAGVDVALVTGDHAATAAFVARAVGIGDHGEVAARGGEGEDAVPRLAGSRVIARATPADKLGLVMEWQRQGEVVAMTGDGVNDAPALRRADIGVAMGDRGTEVARQAADLVLSDDNLTTVVAAVEEGRRVYANIRRFLLYGIAGGASEIIIMLTGWTVGLPLPLLPAQILWVNLLTHSFAGAALGSEPLEPDAMKRPPRDPEEGVLGAGLWWRTLVMAAVLAVVSLAAGRLAKPEAAQTTILLALGAGQLAVAWAVRSRGRERLSAGRGDGMPARQTDPAAPSGDQRRPAWQARLALPAGLLAAGVLLVVVVTEPLQALLSTQAVTLSGAVWPALAALTAYVAARAVRPRAF
jgi:P-type Ca2+ transporter type 2C